MDKTLKGWQTYNHPRVSLQENEIVTRRKGEKTRGKAERGSRIIKPEGNLLSRTFENYSARDSRILSRLLSPRFSFGVSFLSIKKFLLRKERRVSQRRSCCSSTVFLEIIKRWGQIPLLPRAKRETSFHGSG